MRALRATDQLERWESLRIEAAVTDDLEGVVARGAASTRCDRMAFRDACRSSAPEDVRSRVGRWVQGPSELAQVAWSLADQDQHRDRGPIGQGSLVE